MLSNSHPEFFAGVVVVLTILFQFKLYAELSIKYFYAVGSQEWRLNDPRFCERIALETHRNYVWTAVGTLLYSFVAVGAAYEFPGIWCDILAGAMLLFVAYDCIMSVATVHMQLDHQNYSPKELHDRYQTVYEQAKSKKH